MQRKRTARGWPCLGCVCGVCGVVVAPRDFGHGAVRLAGLRSRRRALYCWVCVCTGCCAVLCCVYAYFCCVCFVETAVCVTVRHVNLDMFHWTPLYGLFFIVLRWLCQCASVSEMPSTRARVRAVCACSVNAHALDLVLCIRLQRHAHSRSVTPQRTTHCMPTTAVRAQAVCMQTVSPHAS